MLTLRGALRETFKFDKLWDFDSSKSRMYRRAVASSTKNRRRAKANITASASRSSASRAARFGSRAGCSR
jgi:hypothetical protein